MCTVHFYNDNDFCLFENHKYDNASNICTELPIKLAIDLSNMAKGLQWVKEAIKINVKSIQKPQKLLFWI